MADKIREKGYVYKGHPNRITTFLYNTEKKLGIEKFSMHKLRHYFASRMSAMHIPDEDIMTSFLRKFHDKSMTKIVLEMTKRNKI